MFKKKIAFIVIVFISGLCVFIFQGKHHFGNSVLTYKAPRDIEFTNTPKSSIDNSSKAITWDKPENWVEENASGMRLASFSVPNTQQSKVDVSIVALEGNAGGLLANINRWRGQLGLNPIEEKDIADIVTFIPSSLGEGKLIDIKNGAESNSQRMLVGIAEHTEKQYFLKMTGEHDVLKNEKSNFLDFFKSLKPKKISEISSTKDATNG